VIFKKYSFILLGIIISTSVFAQVTAGKISFERKTNLYKKFKGNDVKEWLREADKNKIDYFELYFNDTASVFKPVESDLKEYMSWATAKNTVYQNFKTEKKYTIKEIWGELLHVRDSLSIRQWQITESSRNIAGYKCRKAIWKINDSTRMYAWFAQELELSTGPESFNGLPGVILGLATEDGGVVYFAKKVEMIKPDANVLTPSKAKKIYTSKELRAKLEEKYGKEKWGKEMIRENFGVW
jgi:GLPGLI family protein